MLEGAGMFIRAPPGVAGQPLDLGMLRQCHSWEWGLLLLEKVLLVWKGKDFQHYFPNSEVHKPRGSRG